MTPQKSEIEYLAVLVHRAHLKREEAEFIMGKMHEGADLDELLMVEFGWSPRKVKQLRTTRGGEIPIIHGYEILGRLGTGGTADVFRARELKTAKQVALKVLKPEATADTATRKAFVAEARLLQRLSHSGLVGCTGVARTETTYFSMLELIEGSTLLEMLDANHAFPEESALRIVLEVAEVLAYLECENIVHRDIKPGNIMLSSSGQVKLIDLGFAAMSNEGAREGSAVGTVAYLSPEQAAGGASADARSDIYSLGISLFHLVVGRLPFESSNDREVLRMQIMDSLRSPELKGRGISPHLHFFIEKMMAKDVEDRYQSWMELTEDIRENLAGRESLDFEREARRKARPR